MSVMRELRRRVRDEQSRHVEPCLPRPASEPPAGPGWIHEIKHDGFRIMAHRRGRNVRLFSRKGYDFADRFPRIAEAVEALPVAPASSTARRSSATTTASLSSSSSARTGQRGRGALRVRPPRGGRRGLPPRANPGPQAKAGWAAAVSARRHRAQRALSTGDGAVIYKHACALGCEGIVSKRLGSPYRAGRTAHG